MSDTMKAVLMLCVTAIIIALGAKVNAGLEHRRIVNSCVYFAQSVLPDNDLDTEEVVSLFGSTNMPICQPHLEAIGRRLVASPDDPEETGQAQTTVPAGRQPATAQTTQPRRRFSELSPAQQDSMRAAYRAAMDSVSRSPFGDSLRRRRDSVGR